MKQLTSVVAVLIAAAFTSSAVAQTADHLVQGYTRANGTYVAPHYETNPNATKNDNYSTQGNVNPYTGQLGTKPGGANVGYQLPAYQPVPAYVNPYAPKAPPKCVGLYC